VRTVSSPRANGTRNVGKMSRPGFHAVLVPWPSGREKETASWPGRGSTQMSFAVERSTRCSSGTARFPRSRGSLGSGRPTHHIGLGAGRRSRRRAAGQSLHSTQDGSPRGKEHVRGVGR